MSCHHLSAEPGITGTRRKLPKLLERASFAKLQSEQPFSGIRQPALDEVFTKRGKEKVLEAVEEGMLSAEREMRQLPSSVALEEETDTTTPIRRNAVGVQLLSPSLHRQLFPGDSLPKPPKSLEIISKRHLKDNDLNISGAAILPEISFDMPVLQGDNIREHFHRLGDMAAQPYLGMAKEFANIDLPAMPARWDTSSPGWVRYGADGTAEQVQDLGEEQMVCFDVETLYLLSPYPVMATAATPSAWYSWLSPAIFADETTGPSIASTLIPLGRKSRNIPRLIVGHNVGYDRARVQDEYCLDLSSNRWLDTLSLHVATKGITSVQRPAWEKRRKEKALDQEQRQEIEEYLKMLDREGNEIAGEETTRELADALGDIESALRDDVDGTASKRWEDVTSANSLAAVARLHCGIKVDKSIRDTFGMPRITSTTQLRPDLDHLLSYCARDVEITHKVVKQVLPLFLESCPHPASFAGALGMGNPFLPIDKSWKEYLRRAETKYRELEGGVKAVLWELAYKLKKRGPVEGDPWTTQLDWSPKAARWMSEEVEGAGEHTEVNAMLVNKESANVSPVAEALASLPDVTIDKTAPDIPRWRQAVESPQYLTGGTALGNPFPYLLQVTCRGYPVVESREHRWVFRVPRFEVEQASTLGHGDELDFAKPHAGDQRLKDQREHFAFFQVGQQRKEQVRVVNLFGKNREKDWETGVLKSPFPEAAQALRSRTDDSATLMVMLQDIVSQVTTSDYALPWSAYLDWSSAAPKPKVMKVEAVRSSRRKPAPLLTETWPKWFWELSAPESRLAKGELNLTVRKRISSLLLRMQWKGYPLFYSREHGWVFRALPDNQVTETMAVFSKHKEGVDAAIAMDENGVYYKLPHPDGDKANVGNPLSKSFLRYVDDGTLRSAPPSAGIEDDGTAAAAADAMAMNAQCSYWVSARERILGQMAVYQDQSGDMGIRATEPGHGMILPQVITMGTVTRRAVENTWLTASNAKKNRVGSELKAMIRAPPGYAIVGADVDSEELWIASVMGDAQFGMHGASAIGWMTLEGTKAAGTDLHSKTAKILGTSRDAAKVFNYSRIYGAGVRHAVRLLRQNDATLSEEQANKRAQDLYTATKGRKAWLPKAHRVAITPDGKVTASAQHVWHGGSETYLFNTLEGIAGHRIPRTPALGCGITDALKKKYLPNDGVFGSDYLPSRINWVVQSSGVDYLHLLIVSMDYLIKKYGISARYMISVHDEVRYLVVEEDRYRAALALQIANAWTRALFCYNIGMDDLPQGVAFFSAVDIDRVFRKEVDMTCVTPSQPVPIPQGESVDIGDVLEKTGGTLGPENDVETLSEPIVLTPIPELWNLRERKHADFLQAQASRGSEGAVRWLIEEAARVRRVNTV